MNREETKAAIAVMQHFADGGEVGDYAGKALDRPLWNWQGISDSYRIAKPAPKKVKLLAYLTQAGELCWHEEYTLPMDKARYVRRVPSEDKEVEVES